MGCCITRNFVITIKDNIKVDLKTGCDDRKEMELAQNLLNFWILLF